MKRALALCALLCACKPRPAAPPAAPLAPVIGEISARFEQVLPRTLPVPEELELAAMVSTAASAVPGKMRVILPAPSGTPHLKLSVDVEVGWPGKGPLRSIVRAHLQPLGEDKGGAVRIDREGLVEKEELKGAPDAELLRRHIAHALELVVGGAVRAEQLWLGPSADARAALVGKDEELRDEAIRIAAERRDREAVPALLPLLKSDDPELRDRAIGALAEIGDPRAAHALAEQAKFGDVPELMKIIDAISRVGGPEAESYLELVISGHPSAEVRDVAQKALSHLRARK
jgi:hypothetical protein